MARYRYRYRLCIGYTCAMAPFVCPVNYSCSKLSGNEVPGSCLGHSLASKVLPSAHPRGEKTNKSASVLRRDIVSCEVNHLRGSKISSTSSSFSARTTRIAPTKMTFVTFLEDHLASRWSPRASCGGPVSDNSQKYTFIISIIEAPTPPFFLETLMEVNGWSFYPIDPFFKS